MILDRRMLQGLRGLGQICPSGTVYDSLTDSCWSTSGALTTTPAATTNVQLPFGISPQTWSTMTSAQQAAMMAQQTSQIQIAQVAQLIPGVNNSTLLWIAAGLLLLMFLKR